MDTLIIVLLGLYILFESSTALNEMKKVSIFMIFHELGNPYTVKYMALIGYSLVMLYHADQIHGWYVLLPLPTVMCVIGRTIYRFRHMKIVL
jgi:hypothetical protein